MATYVSLLKWTEQGIQGIKESAKRVRHAQQAVEKAGGRIVSVYYTQGEFDLVAVYEWPDDESANAFFLSLASAGNVRSQTSRAYSLEEMERIISKMP